MKEQDPGVLGAKITARATIVVGLLSAVLSPVLIALLQRADVAPQIITRVLHSDTSRTEADLAEARAQNGEIKKQLEQARTERNRLESQLSAAEDLLAERQKTIATLTELTKKSERPSTPLSPVSAASSPPAPYTYKQQTPLGQTFSDPQTNASLALTKPPQADGRALLQFGLPDTRNPVGGWFGPGYDRQFKWNGKSYKIRFDGYDPERAAFGTSVYEIR